MMQKSHLKLDKNFGSICVAKCVYLKELDIAIVEHKIKDIQLKKDRILVNLISLFASKELV